jgi:hypothetical protein
MSLSDEKSAEILNGWDWQSVSNRTGIIVAAYGDRIGLDEGYLSPYTFARRASTAFAGIDPSDAVNAVTEDMHNPRAYRTRQLILGEIKVLPDFERAETIYGVGILAGGSTVIMKRCLDALDATESNRDGQAMALLMLASELAIARMA